MRNMIIICLCLCHGKESRGRVILYNRFKVKMSEQALHVFFERSQTILSEPESIEPLELAQYFHAFLNYGVHDHITSLV